MLALRVVLSVLEDTSEDRLCREALGDNFGGDGEPGALPSPGRRRRGGNGGEIYGNLWKMMEIYGTCDRTR